MIHIDYPGGRFEPMFAAIAPMLQDGPPDPEAMARTTAEYGLEILGPPLSAVSAPS